MITTRFMAMLSAFPRIWIDAASISKSSDVAVFQKRFHLTKGGDKPSLGYDFENRKVVRQAFDEFARYLEKPNMKTFICYLVLATV